MRCCARSAGSSNSQYAWPARVVGTSDAATVAAARRRAGVSNAIPPMTCTAPFKRTSVSVSVGIFGCTFCNLGPTCSVTRFARGASFVGSLNAFQPLSTNTAASIVRPTVRTGFMSRSYPPGGRLSQLLTDTSKISARLAQTQRPESHRGPERVPADETQHLGLGVRVVTDLEPDAILARRADDLLHLLHLAEELCAEVGVQPVVLAGSPGEIPRVH